MKQFNNENSWEDNYMAKFTVGNENHALIELYFEDHSSGKIYFKNSPENLIDSMDYLI